MFTQSQRSTSFPQSSDRAAHQTQAYGNDSGGNTNSSGGSDGSSSIDASSAVSGNDTKPKEVVSNGGDFEYDSESSDYFFESSGSSDIGGPASTSTINCRRIASTLKSRAPTGLDDDDLKILDILEYYPPILLDLDLQDPADIVEILHDYLADDCPLVGSSELRSNIHLAVGTPT